MKIINSAVDLTSTHSLNRFSATQSSNHSSFSTQFTAEQKMQSESLHFQAGGSSRRSVATNVSFKAQSTTAFQQSNRVRASLSVTIRQQILVLERVLTGLTGQRIPIYWIADTYTAGTERMTERLRYRVIQAFMDRQHESESQRSSEIWEDEQLNFNAQGYFQTDDGKLVQFDCTLHLGREFASRNGRLLENRDKLLDPLVINFNGTAADLTQTHFHFDLDCDGAAEELPFVTEGSGFLALDRNQDGKVNDGSELFGPTVGNGFEELAAFDQDRNGWIDENDPIFERLRIWTRDASGQEELVALGQKGVGAIFLGNVAAPFDMRDVQNSNLAVNRSAGIFAREDGTVGTIQQLDLVIPADMQPSKTAFGRKKDKLVES